MGSAARPDLDPVSLGEQGDASLTTPSVVWAISTSGVSWGTITWMSSYGKNDGTQDRARAIADLAERLPEPLVPLARLVFNYRWVMRDYGTKLYAPGRVEAGTGH